MPSRLQSGLSLISSFATAAKAGSVTGSLAALVAYGCEACRLRPFHAKLIVADYTLAYVGSANLLYSSEGLSLETGLLVEGSACRIIVRMRSSNSPSRTL